jgi:peptidoglycan/LPS O-acetylase OafA/YrhL
VTNKADMDLPNLDLLRSVAVLCVVFAHLLAAFGIESIGRFDILSIAPFGVYMFFVHTSLVLMWSLQRRPNALDFYIRRVFRLYPLAIFAILVVACLHLPVQGDDKGVFYGPPITLYNVIFNCLLLHPVIGHAPLLLGTLWTLTPELLMYILLPCLFFYAHSVRKVWPLLLIVAMDLLISKMTYRPADQTSFGVLIPDFMAGVIAYTGFMKRKATVPSWLFPVFIFLLMGYFLTVHLTNLRGQTVVSLAMGLALPSFIQMKSKTLRTVTHTIAKYSYGIYLFHFITLYLGVSVLRSHSLAVRLIAFSVPLAIIVVAVYHLLEAPMIRLGARVAARWAHERGLPSEKSLEALEPAP